MRLPCTKTMIPIGMAVVSLLSTASLGDDTEAPLWPSPYSLADRRRDQSKASERCDSQRCGSRRRSRNLRPVRWKKRERSGWNNSFRFVTTPWFADPNDTTTQDENEHTQADAAETESEDDIQIGAAITGEEVDSSLDNYHPSSYLAATWTFQHSLIDVDASSTESQDEGEPTMGTVASLKDEDASMLTYDEEVDRHQSYPWHPSSSTSTTSTSNDEVLEETDGTILFDLMPHPEASPIVFTDTTTRNTAAAACQPPLSSRDRRLQLEALITQSITPSDVLYDTTSPHNAAFHWLVYEDAAVVCPEATKDVIQRYVLAALYFSMGQWDRSCLGGQCVDGDAFLSNSNVCDWEHVICPRGSGTVVALALENTNGVGFLPLELSNFGVLHTLTVSGNAGLRGRIPISYGNFGVLRKLNLHDNALSGKVPTQLCDLITLDTLNVAGNQLTGQVPECLGTPGNLLSIDLSRNLLTGAIPSSIFDSIGCHTLHLHNNMLNGTIPEEIVSLSPAVDLSFHRNQLSGTLPSSIQSLQNLKILSLYGNEMTGPIPSELGQLGQIERIFLHDNDFSGSVPESICNLRLDRGGSLAHLTADCGIAGKVDCDCCTACF